MRCAECPGFVVNRILLSTAAEVWRYQDESGASVEEIDELLRERAQMPMGPFRVADMSGLDTTVKVAQDLLDAYGDRFYVASRDGGARLAGQPRRQEREGLL